jgi:type II secretory pathway pseudopilin PulG
MVLAVLGVIVGVLALGVSIWSVMSSRKTANVQAELQQRLLALEISREQTRARQAQSAQVRAAIKKTGARDWRLFVVNEGAVTARNVKVELDGAPLLTHTLVPRGQDELTKLGPGASVRYLLAPAMQKPMSVEARITWDDDSGETRFWESQLNL